MVVLSHSWNMMASINLSPCIIPPNASVFKTFKEHCCKAMMLASEYSRITCLHNTSSVRENYIRMCWYRENSPYEGPADQANYSDLHHSIFLLSMSGIIETWILLLFWGYLLFNRRQSQGSFWSVLEILCTPVPCN